MCMYYINPAFSELSDIESINKQYSTNNTKIFNLFDSYIDFLKTNNIDIIDLNIYINNTENSLIIQILGMYFKTIQNL